MLSTFTIRLIHDAFAALNLLSTSIIPIPPFSILPIKVFLLILSLFFHKKLYISFETLLKKSTFGFCKIKALYNILEIAKVLMIVHFPNIVRFRFFQTLRIF